MQQEPQRPEPQPEQQAPQRVQRRRPIHFLELTELFEVHVRRRNRRRHQFGRFLRHNRRH